MSANWIQVDIDLALLSAFGLVIFAWLHWLAMKKSNNQNLFAMRIKHYKIFYQLCNEFLIKIEYYKPEDIPHSVEVEALNRLILELDNYIDESKFLFNEALYKLEFEFVNYAKRAFEKFSAKEAISVAELQELQSFYKNSKNWIEDFLAKNKP